LEGEKASEENEAAEKNASSKGKGERSSPKKAKGIEVAII